LKAKLTKASGTAKTFYVYDQDALIARTEGMIPPYAGVTYMGLSPSSNSPYVFLLRFGIMLTTGDEDAAYSDAGRGMTEEHTRLLDSIRGGVLNTAAPTGKPWRFVSENPIESDKLGINFLQVWESDTYLTPGTPQFASGASLDGIPLPVLTIHNEFGWCGIIGSASKLIGQGHAYAGESRTLDWPVDLVGSDSPETYATRYTLRTLRDKAKVLHAQYVLTYGARRFTIRFRHEESPVISADPVLQLIAPTDTDLYQNVAIRLMVLEEL
jgi:hypothetical protein